MIGHSERELLEELKDSLRSAAEDCDQIAIHPFRGFVYDAMRKKLKKIEMLCFQVGRYRDGDCRWFPVGTMMEQVHKRAGNWLRTMQSADSRNQAVPLFRKLADNLRSLHAQIINLETKRTGVMGSIIPAINRSGNHRDSNSVGWRRSKGGVILPSGAGA